MSDGMLLSNRHQRTFKQKIGCVGTGLTTGQRVAMTFNPADANHGIAIRRTDIAARDPCLISHRTLHASAHTAAVRHRNGYQTSTLDGLIIALAHCRIDNAVIDLSGAEPPFMDGSGQPFAFLIECAGIDVVEDKPKRLDISQTVRLDDAGSSIALQPAQRPSLNINGEEVAGPMRRSDPLLVKARRPLPADGSIGRAQDDWRLPGHQPLWLTEGWKLSPDEMTEIERYGRALFISCALLCCQTMNIGIQATNPRIDLLIDAMNLIEQNTTLAETSA